MSSLETAGAESIQVLGFAESFSRRGESSPGPTLWAGTSLGSVLVVGLALPDCARSSQPVLVTPTGSVFRLRGSILSITFLDAHGCLMPTLFESWRDFGKEGDERRSRSQSTNQCGRPLPGPGEDSQFAVLASEKQARVVALPSQNCAYRATLTETSFVVRAQVVSLKGLDSVCLACYVATGNIVIFSLPSLRVLKDVDFLPLIDIRIARTFSFSNNGHGMYLCTPSELQKFTISASFCDGLQDMLGTVFLTREMPEAPKQSFFRGLFASTPSPLDREELFGEASGKPSKSLARHIPGNIEYVKSQTSTLGGELARARQGLTERGEALSQLDERTARMMSEAESFANATHQLMNKYKDKKWYQF